ncbi:hypothetical protein F4802DRAFT_583048 [Xylaria palmicola]|nr:hypothetical protein F4802DRAFT_583048 [Xylaria palmicola]
MSLTFFTDTPSFFFFFFFFWFSPCITMYRRIREIFSYSKLSRFAAVSFWPVQNSEKSAYLSLLYRPLYTDLAEWESLPPPPSKKKR